jgi:PilZ domain
MTGIPGTDYPEVRTVVDLLLSSRPDAMISWVEAADGDELVLAPAEDRERRPFRSAVGERMDVVWRGPDDLLSLPAELVAVESGAAPVWHLRSLGPAVRGQRRAAVRAPMATPVRFDGPAGAVPGMTVDVSEGGLRVLVDVPPGSEPSADPPDGAPPPGSIVPLVLTLGEVDLPCRGEVLRHIHHDDRWQLTLRFVGMHENTQDFIRRHVFERLRTLRARGVL